MRIYSLRDNSKDPKFLDKDVNLTLDFIVENNGFINSIIRNESKSGGITTSTVTIIYKGMDLDIPSPAQIEKTKSEQKHKV